METYCYICNKKLSFWNTSLIKRAGNRICTDCVFRNKDDVRGLKQISETRVTCSNCGNIWHYGKNEELENTSNNLINLGKTLMCCTGCLPALLISDSKTVSFDRCQKCGSRAVTKEKIIHDIE
jgi:hypothetical protein